MFYVGQKVVCVDNKPRIDADHFGPFRRTFPMPLTIGEIYTVRGFDRNGSYDYGLYLIECRSTYPARRDGTERGFYSSRFRPLVERKTDISIFTKILDKTKSKEPV